MDAIPDELLLCVTPSPCRCAYLLGLLSTASSRAHFTALHSQSPHPPGPSPTTLQAFQTLSKLLHDSSTVFHSPPPLLRLHPLHSPHPPPTARACRPPHIYNPLEAFTKSLDPLYPPPLCDIPSGCCFFTGPWTVTRSSLRMLRRVAAFCRPLRPGLLLVSFPRSRSPVVGVLGLCWMWQGVPFARQRRPVVSVLGLCWLLQGSFDCFYCPHTSVLRPLTPPPPPQPHDNPSLHSQPHQALPQLLHGPWNLATLQNSATPRTALRQPFPLQSLHDPPHSPSTGHPQQGCL